MREAHEKQRGVALIIALILVALAAILATKLSFDGWLERRRTIGIIAAEQALQFGMGAEALAADVLSQSKQNGAQQDTLAQPWAQPTQPLPITPENDPEGEPIGTVQGAIEDMQGRFNLNNLAHVDAGRANRIRSRCEQFQRLLVSVGLEPKWAGIARDWIDADDQPGKSGRRGGFGLYAPNSALPHRQLAHDEPERIDEHARASAPTATARSHRT